MDPDRRRSGPTHRPKSCCPSAAWPKNVGGSRFGADPQVTGHKARESRRRELWSRFEQACDRDQITPPDWLRLAAQHDPGFDRAMLLAWYRIGDLPEGGHGDRLMNLVEQWLESS